jgi:Tfp pilus assembly protein PilV
MKVSGFTMQISDVSAVALAGVATSAKRVDRQPLSWILSPCTRGGGAAGLRSLVHGLWSRRRCAAAFNLIEVTLSVAIVAVGMLAILGLLGGALNASREVKDNTVISLLVDDFLNWRSITPYDRPTFFPYGAVLTNATRPYSYTNYFDVNGYLSSDYSGAALANWAAYMRFIYTVKDQPDFPNSRDIARVLLQVDWPINPVNSNTISGVTQTRQYINDVSRHW